MRHFQFLRAFASLSALFLVAAVMLLASIGDVLAQAAAAGTTVDITNSVTMLIGIVVTVIVGVLLFIARAAIAKYTGIQISDSAMATAEAFLENLAHAYINTHLLKSGPITVNTKSNMASQMVSDLNRHLPDVVDELNLNSTALTAKAEGIAAKVLNLMPNVPPVMPALPKP